MTLDTYEFSSCFAPYIEGLIQHKHEEGFLFNSARHILISFDRFCIRKGYHTPMVTKEISKNGGCREAGKAEPISGTGCPPCASCHYIWLPLGSLLYPGKVLGKKQNIGLCPQRG